MSEPINTGRLFVAKPTFARVVAWLCTAFFTFCSVMAWRAGQGEVAPWFLIFVGLGVFTLVSAGSIEMNSQFIYYRSPWATYVMKWDEVERIEVDAQGGAIVFVGVDKRLVALGTRYWAGQDKPEMLALLAAKVKEREIPVQQTQRALLRLSKNTKVR